ncbi:MAG: protein translocase subunit SecF [Candidatus Acetothermia bacterium]|nr:protein translocase subunit SecF [Candidatus Acetothermia bacterium]
MTQFDFMGKAKYFSSLSGALVLASILVLVFVGLRPGIDFTGGIQLTIFYPTGTNLTNDALRSYLAPLVGEGTAKSTLYVQSVTADREGVTLPGKIVTVRESSEELKARMREALARPAAGSGIPEPAQVNGLPDTSVTDIGAQVSREIVNRAWQAILVAMAAMLVYIAWRFRLRYAVGAVAALIHDVVITLGVFALFRLEIDLPVIAALLTVVGYSLNDTIVIFDRVRENLKLSKKTPLRDLINRSINQTLTRTINTVSTTLVPIVILFVFGGTALRGFTVAMLMGVIVGTYSTFYVANPIFYWWTLTAEKARARR